MKYSKKKIKIGVIGQNGMLGLDLVKFLSASFEVDGITRENYKDHHETSFDVLINANGNSRRFWANQNIYSDFEQSTISVYKTLSDFKFKKYIYISSSDVYKDHSKTESTLESQVVKVEGLCPYGFHKYLSEQIIRNNCPKYLILRMSMMLGSCIKKGPVFDILNNRPLFVTPDSCLQIINTKEVASIIEILITKSVDNDVFNVGGTGSLIVRKIAGILNKIPDYHRDAEKQQYEMDISKLSRLFPLKSSENYLQNFLEYYNK